jgi:excisionase family DNA binding protein
MGIAGFLFPAGGGGEMANKIMSDMQAMVDEIMNKLEVAEVFKLNPRTLQYLISTKQIPFSRVGKRIIRFSRQRLLEWLREREGI